ncbi:hypothetical protein DPMN_017105 [Dreissena polymorpha]|uniref:Uncharacterized protein n=1 Tax=Dreissena polymorpha TaxID=45954 RepID=A0A9D4NAT9_DREPO|nr:hypothetical protein DPMN_017105 [Dreissena polymorpha]
MGRNDQVRIDQAGNVLGAKHPRTLQWLLGNSLQFRSYYYLYKTYFRSPWKSQDNPGDPVRK